MDCPFKVGQKIEGKEVFNEGFFGVGRTVKWHVANVEQLDGNLMKLSCPALFDGSVKFWVEYNPDWFREYKEEVK